MRWLSPYERRQRRRRHLAVAGVFLLGLVAVHLVDRAVVVHFSTRALDESGGWVQMWRAVGFLPTWLFIAGALVLVDRTGGTSENFWASGRRGIPLALSAAMAGLAAEALKILISRERPPGLGGGTEAELARVGAHVQHLPLSDLWAHYESGLGMPSSHTAVAFGGAFMLSRLVPGVWPVAMLAAAGCAYTRLAAGAHFLSDVYVGVFVAYAVSWMVDRAVPPRPVRDELDRIEAARSGW